MAPFSFIKTSILIFAYLFLWHQTNYQHQVSALSTLKDDASDASNSTLYSSSEGEDINKTNVRAKTLGSDGPHVPHKGYGDYHPPLKKGGGGTVPPFGGQYPHPTSRYGTPKKNHVTSNFGTLNSGTPKNKSFSQRSKRVKDVLKALWKKCVCQGNKHPRWVMFFAVVIMAILYSLALLYTEISKKTGECFFAGCSGVTVTKVPTTTTALCEHLTTTATSIMVPTVLTIIIGAAVAVLFGFYCWKRKECNKRKKF